ncbi:MAG: four helix bundle protein [Candidatus Moranbacteria bacterium]|jgi:four helix bundle protein|nr:four helix bundle protein [Candidatus Moranbacteria bacterium]
MNNFDLEERTAKFAEEIIELCKELEITPLNRRIIDQLIGSSGSIGANYCEACEAESKKDFRHKMGIAKKEIKETKHWLRLLVKVHGDKKDKCRILWKEAHALLLIFSKSIETSKNGK